jgi:hypothetical protein
MEEQTKCIHGIGLEIGVVRHGEVVTWRSSDFRLDCVRFLAADMTRSLELAVGPPGPINEESMAPMETDTRTIPVFPRPPHKDGAGIFGASKGGIKYLSSRQENAFVAQSQVGKRI